MLNLKFAPILETMLSEKDKIAIIDYINGKNKTYKLNGNLNGWYFPIRKSNGLTSFELIDVYVNMFNLILPFEIKK